MDDTNPFGTFPTQPAPMFEDNPKVVGVPIASETPASPKRRSRRSQATPAAPSRPSSAKPAKPVTAKRKYTRRSAVTPAENAVVGLVARKVLEGSSELDIVTEIVTKLRALDTKTRARVIAAIGKLL